MIEINNQFETNNSPLVFVCYSPKEGKKVSSLCSRLKSDKINIWFDQENLLPGQKRKEEIPNVIGKSSAILICLTKTSVTEAGEIQADIKASLEKAKEKPDGSIFIIPVKLEECEIPPSLSPYHSASIYETDGYNNLLRSLQLLQNMFLLLSASNSNSNHLPLLEENVEESMAKSEQLLEKIKEKIGETGSRQLRFVVVGLAGAGKSSTINALFGKEMAEVKKYVATTHTVTSYQNESLGVKYKIFDTPGLGESIDDTKNTEYIKLMKEKITEIDCVLYVTHLDHSRVSSDEQRCIKLFSEAFGSSIWDHSVIVFTLKHPMTSEEYIDGLSERTKLIRKEIHRFAKINSIENIPSVGINISANLMPDNTEWISDFFLKILERISDLGRVSFVLANADRINSGNIPLSQEQKENIFSKFLNDPAITETAKEVGASLGLSVGSVVLFVISAGLGGLPGAIFSTGVSLYAFYKYFNKDKN